MTDSTTRTYSIGEVLPDSKVADGLYTERTTDWCMHNTMDVGHGSCSMPKGHGGPQHLAALYNGTIVGLALNEPTDDGPTWKTGDSVMRDQRVVSPGTPDIAIGTVIGVDGAFAHLVGRIRYESEWRHHRVPNRALRPGSGGVPGPTLEEIGAALLQPLRVSVEAPTVDAVATTADAERIASLERRLTAVQAAHEQFRTTVRDKAIELAKEHNWCSVVDQGLIAMGLSPMRRKWEVEVAVRASQTITVTVEEADDEDAAREMVNTYTVRDNVSSYDWEIDSDDWEITDVNESEDY